VHDFEFMPVRHFGNQSFGGLKSLIVLDRHVISRAEHGIDLVQVEDRANERIARWKLPLAGLLL
jgi:hypothetical protein